MTPSPRSWLLVAAVLAAALVLYGPSLNGGFVYDDFGYIYAFGWYFRDVSNFEMLQWFWVPRVGFAMGTYRPVLELSYVFEWDLWGANPFGYRLTNLLLHVGNALLIARIALRLGMMPLAAGCAALLFAISPAHPETCTWLSARVNVLALFFMLLATLMFLRCNLWLSLIPTALALGSKETALALPPILSAWALVATEGSVRERVVATIKATVPHWLLVVGFFALRYHTLGVIGGSYPDAPDVGSLEFVTSRLWLQYATLAPVNELRNPEFWRWVLMVLNGSAFTVLLFAVVRTRTGASISRASALFLFAWILCANVPLYAAPFSTETVVNMMSSRLLYEPTVAVVLAVGFLVGCAPRRGLLIGIAVASYFVVAWNNAGPWAESERIARAVDVVAEDFVATHDAPLLLVDLPDVFDGAFLYANRDESPRLMEPVHTAKAVAQVTLVRASAWEQGLRLIDAHLDSGRADGLVVRRLERASRWSAEIVDEPVDDRWPLRVTEDLTVRCARCPVFGLRAGGELELQMLVDSENGAGALPLVLRLVDDTGAKLDEFTRGSTEADGRHALRMSLPLRSELSGRRVHVELSVGGRTERLVSIEL